MSTYYKYAERNVDSQINWAEVGRGITDMLSQEAQIREEKKAAIDEASREFAEVLANAPQGEYQPMNEWILKFGDDAAQMRLMQDQLLKSGQLKLRDYTAMRQNLTDGVNDLFGISEQVQRDAELKMQRYKDGESQELEAWLMEQVQGLAKFQSAQGYINPATGQVSLGKMVKGKDGVMVLSKEPQDLMSMQQLKNYISTPYDYYDSTAQLQENVANIGEYVTQNYEKLEGLLRTGKIDSISDKTARKEFEKVLNKQIEAMMENPYNVLSILTNDIVSVIGDDGMPTGEQWDFEWYQEGKEYKKNQIAMYDDGSGMPKPKLTEFQKEQVREYLKTMEVGMISKTIESRTVSGGSPVFKPVPNKLYDDQIKTNEDALSYWNQLYWGDAEQKKAAAESLLSHDQASGGNLRKIDLSEEGVVRLIYKDGSTRPIDYRTSTLKEFAATGSVIHGVKNIDKALQAGGGVPQGAGRNLVTAEGAEIIIGESSQDFSSEEAEKVLYSQFSSDDRKDASTHGKQNLEIFINKKLGGFGFTAKAEDKKRGKGNIYVETPSGSEIKIPTGANAMSIIDNMIQAETSNPTTQLILGVEKQQKRQPPQRKQEPLNGQ